MKSVDNRLETLPEVWGEAWIVERGKRAVKMQRELGFRTGENHGTLFTRLLETKTGVQRKTVESTQVQIESAATSPTGLDPRFGIEGQERLRKQRAFADTVEQVRVFRQVQ